MHLTSLCVSKNEVSKSLWRNKCFVSHVHVKLGYKDKLEVKIDNRSLSVNSRVVCWSRASPLNGKKKIEKNNLEK